MMSTYFENKFFEMDPESIKDGIRIRLKLVAQTMGFLSTN